MVSFPTIERIRATADAIGPYIVRTPIQPWRGREIGAAAVSLQ